MATPFPQLSQKELQDDDDIAPFHFIAAAMSMMILIKMLSLVTCYGHNQTKDADMAGWPYKKGGHHRRETEYMRGVWGGVWGAIKTLRSVNDMNLRL